MIIPSFADFCLSKNVSIKDNFPCLKSAIRWHKTSHKTSHKMLAEKTNLSKVFRALDSYTQPPSLLKKTFKTKVKRKQKLVAATITCLLWRSKSFREKVQSLYFPERYYFRGDRAKSIKKSDPSIFYCCCNLL